MRSLPATAGGRERTALALAPSGFLKLFWTVTTALVVYSLVTLPDRPAVFTLSALVIAGIALLPSYLWCSSRVSGLPIYPVFCSTFIVTHALQLLLAYPRLQTFSEKAIEQASFTVSAFLLVCTLVWWWWVRRPRTIPRSCLVLKGQRGSAVLLLVIAISATFTVLDHAHWLSQIPEGIYSVLRGSIRGVTGFAIFVLAMRWGARQLQPSQAYLFLVLFTCFCIADLSSLFLITAIAMCLMMVIGFMIGRKSVPWTMLAVVSLVATALHLGKGEMRNRYWLEGQGHFIEPWRYPDFFVEWLQASWDELSYQRRGGEETASIFERANTIYLLLQAQEMTPDEVPYLRGQTYALIPDSLVPRIFHSEKTSPHDSTTILNVHYGNQTWDAAQTTSIGWGLLNEAFANFGMLGCFVLAVLLGSCYGLVTRWSIGLPPTSLPFIVGIFTISFALQTEMTASIIITAYAQGLFAVLILTSFFAERETLRPETLNKKEFGLNREPSIS